MKLFASRRFQEEQYDSQSQSTIQASPIAFRHHFYSRCGPFRFLLGTIIRSQDRGLPFRTEPPAVRLRDYRHLQRCRLPLLAGPVDNCSVSLFGLFFKAQRIRFVTISFENLVNGVYRQELKITLNDVQISSISDAGIGATFPQERLTLAYGRITIFDPQTGQTSSFDVLLGR